MGAYIPQAWVNEATDLSAANFNHIEAGVRDATKLLASDGAAVVGNSGASGEQGSAVEWMDHSGFGGVVGRLVTGSPLVGGSIVDRAEMWAKAASRSGATSATRKIIDSAGGSDFYTPSPWYDCQAVFGTNYSAGTNPTNDWVHVMVRKVQPDKVEIRGLFKMNAASVAGGASREAFRFDNITDLGNLSPARFHMLKVMAENHSINRFDVAPGSPNITWTSGSGVNTGWFWIHDEWFL